MSSVVQQRLIVREDFERQHEQTVREEIERFRAKAEQVLAGTVTEDEFRSFRLRYGIYGQRQPGVQMVRTKFPSGMSPPRNWSGWRKSPTNSAAGAGISPRGR